jgi:hypothetical protein
MVRLTVALNAHVRAFCSGSSPYGLAMTVPNTYDRLAASRPCGNAAVVMKSVVADPARYDWEPFWRSGCEGPPES